MVHTTSNSTTSMMLELATCITIDREELDAAMTKAMPVRFLSSIELLDMAATLTVEQLTTELTKVN
jgi:hypothetical protein